MDDKKLRHAYLIMAHGNYPILEKQLRFLDSENADFFVYLLIFKLAQKRVFGGLVRCFVLRYLRQKIER